MVAVNGAPLGDVRDQKAFGRKLRTLRRPVRLTFERSGLRPEFVNAPPTTDQQLESRMQSLEGIAFGITYQVLLLTH